MSISWPGPGVPTPRTGTERLHPAGSMRPVVIAGYTPDREADLVSMWRESFEFGVGVADPHPLHEQVAFFRSQVLPRCEVRVALDGDTLVGFMAATPSRIEQLYVRVGMHRRGIGTALLAGAKARAPNCLHLYTFARNRVACSFYERHGFVIEQRGFEPEWQLDDVLYRWDREDAAG